MSGLAECAVNPRIGILEWPPPLLSWSGASRDPANRVQPESELGQKHATAESNRSFVRAIGAWIMPATVRGDKRVSLFRAPGAAFVAANPMMVLEDSIDDFPRRFNRVLAGKQRSVALHGIAQ